MRTIEQERHIIQKRKEGQDLDKQIAALTERRDRALVEYELLISHYPADSAAEKDQIHKD
jgi:hypothetical protein